MVTAKMKIS